MKIIPPTNCPSCSSVLVYRNDQLYCVSEDCEATGFKKVEHFAKTLKIKGLGPAAIEKLDISSIEDIYELDLTYMTVKLNSAKIAEKLLEEIEKSKHASLEQLLPAFGIPLVGKTAGEKLSKVCESIFDINMATAKQAGLGDKASTNLVNWINSAFEDKYADLPFTYEFTVSTSSVSEVKRGVVCISGKLNSFKTKADAAAALEAEGFIVKDSVTKDVTIFVNESGRETDKTKKARDAGLIIINNLKEYLENL